MITTDIKQLEINYLTEDQYNTAKRAGTLDENALYMTEGAIADYVVEQGTSDIWTYRKWNSGIAECWGYWTTTSTFPNAYNGAYESANSLKKNLPSGLFTEVAPLFSGVALTSNGAWIENPRAYTTEVSTYVLNVVKQTSAINVSIYAKVTGKWK